MNGETLPGAPGVYAATGPGISHHIDGWRKRTFLMNAALIASAAGIENQEELSWR